MTCLQTIAANIRRRPFVAVLLAVGGILQLGASQVIASDVSLRAIGRGLLEGHCARCHQILPDGPSPLAAAPPLRDIARKYPVEHLAESLAEGIVTGHLDMPVFAFAAPEVDAILAYLNSLAPAAR